MLQLRTCPGYCCVSWESACRPASLSKFAVGQFVLFDVDPNRNVSDSLPPPPNPRRAEREKGLLAAIRPFQARILTRFGAGGVARHCGADSGVPGRPCLSGVRFAVGAQSRDGGAGEAGRQKRPACALTPCSPPLRLVLSLVDLLPWSDTTPREGPQLGWPLRRTEAMRAGHFVVAPASKATEVTAKSIKKTMYFHIDILCARNLPEQEPGTCRPRYEINIMGRTRGGIACSRTLSASCSAYLKFYRRKTYRSPSSSTLSAKN